jgi:acetyl esterase/lipase
LLLGNLNRSLFSSRHLLEEMVDVDTTVESSMASAMETVSFDEVRSSVSTDSLDKQPLLGPSTPLVSSRRVIFDSLSSVNVAAASSSTAIISRRRASISPLQDFPLQYHASVIVFESFNLASFLFHGTPRWIAKLVRLVCFVIALFPAFMVFFTFYVLSSDRIALPYKQNSSNRTSRHYLDLYGSTTTISGKKKGHQSQSSTDSTCRSEDEDKSKSSSQQQEELKPVVVFLTGGAWIIGYKMWGALMARALVPFGIMVVIPDYRNFPQTNVEGMIDDVDWALDWTLKNCQAYGGDPNKVVLAGQSAGAHLGACLMLRKSKLQQPKPSEPSTSTPLMSVSIETDTSRAAPLLSQRDDAPAPPATSTSWRALDIKGFIAVSGPYDLVSMRDILHEHGLDKSIVSAMFRNDLAQYSPTLIVRELLLNTSTSTSSKSKQIGHCGGTDGEEDTSTSLDVMRRRVQTQFPPTCIIHGQVDKTVPFKISLDFYHALKELQLEQQPPLEFKLYPSWSHTDPILEAPFAGNHLFHRDVYDLVKLWTTTASTSSSLPPLYKETSENNGSIVEGNEGEGDSSSQHKSNLSVATKETETENSGKSVVLMKEESRCLLPFDENNLACKKICPLFLVQVGRFCNPF